MGGGWSSWEEKGGGGRRLEEKNVEGNNKVHLQSHPPMSQLPPKFSFQKSRLVFNLEYFWQIFIKFNNQGQFWNPHDKQIEISKLSLIFRFDEELTEISKVKDKAWFT